MVLFAIETTALCASQCQFPMDYSQSYRYNTLLENNIGFLPLPRRVVVCVFSGYYDYYQQVVVRMGRLAEHKILAMEARKGDQQQELYKNSSFEVKEPRLRKDNKDASFLEQIGYYAEQVFEHRERMRQV